MVEQNNMEKWGMGEKKVKVFMLVGIVLSLFLLVKIAEGLREYHYIGKNITSPGTIVVSGKGELNVKPDIATVSFSVMEENLDVSKASDAVNKKIAAIVAALKADGIADKDIKTTDYNVYPRYDYISTTNSYGGRQVLVGYDVTQGIEIKIRDLTKSGKIIAELSSLGATNVSGLTFTSDNSDDLVRQARDMAIADARDQAQKLARALGVELGGIVNYSEGGNYPMPYAMGFAGAMKTDSVAAPVPAVLPTGENKITSNVTITYEIR